MTIEQILNEMAVHEKDQNKFYDKIAELLKSDKTIEEIKEFIKNPGGEFHTNTNIRRMSKKNISEIENRIQDDPKAIEKFKTLKPVSNHGWQQFEREVSKKLEGNISERNITIKFIHSQPVLLSKIINNEIDLEKVDIVKYVSIESKRDVINEIGEFEVKKLEPSKLSSNYGVRFAESISPTKNDNVRELYKNYNEDQVNEALLKVTKYIAPLLNNKIQEKLNKPNKYLVIGRNTEEARVIPFTKLSFSTNYSGHENSPKIHNKQGKKRPRITIGIRVDNYKNFPTLEEFANKNLNSRKQVVAIERVIEVFKNEIL